MALTFRKLHRHFVAEVSPVDAVLVFRDQPFADDEHLAFAQRLDGRLHSRTGSRVLGKSRLGDEALSDISNVDEAGDIMQADDRRRMYGLRNQHLGFDPVWFGIIIVCVVEIGLISPPVGMNMFVIKTLLPEVPTGTVFRGVMPFMWADVLRLAILVAFPPIALWLPSLMR